jgi:hypothetical protein
MNINNYTDNHATDHFSAMHTKNTISAYRVLTFFAALLFLCLNAYAAPERLSCTAESLKSASSLHALPDQIRTVLDHQFGEKVRIADHGEALDDLDDKGLGPRRFSIAGINNSCAIVVLQLGGQPYHFDILVFERDESGWHARRQGTIPKPPATMEALIADSESALCSSDEDVLFSCSPGHRRNIAICSSKNLTPTSGYIQYRAAKGDMVEFVYPEKTTVHPSKVFAFKERPWGQGEENSLRFYSGKYAYTAYSNDGCFSSEHGVLVQRDGKTVERLSCKGLADGDLDLTVNMQKITNGGVPEPTEQYDVLPVRRNQ